MNPMLMNQFGMNPMMMNQMQMNQNGMNQMGMNNQFNQINQMNMDNTTLNIKNIVEPYEKKIKELEEIIRQKDFEITVLKQKLNSSNNKNIMNMNINPINMNPNNINQMGINENFNSNQQLELKGNNIKLFIKTDNEEFQINCFERDKISTIREKCNIFGKELVYNYRILFENLTFSEFGIKKYSTIEAKSINVQNIIFKDISGRVFNSALNDDCPLNIALMYYFIINGDPFQLILLINKKIQINFLYNANRFDYKDETPIGHIFKTPNPTVQVICNKIV